MRMRRDLDLNLNGWSANSHEGQRADGWGLHTSAASRPLKEVMVSASANVAGSWFHSGRVLNMVERQRGEERRLARGLSRRWSPFRLFCWVFLMFTSSGGMAKCLFIILYNKMSLWSRRRFARSFHPRSWMRQVTLTVPYWLRVHRAAWRWIRSSADWCFCMGVKVEIASHEAESLMGLRGDGRYMRLPV